MFPEYLRKISKIIYAFFTIVRRFKCQLFFHNFAKKSCFYTFYTKHLFSFLLCKQEFFTSENVDNVDNFVHNFTFAIFRHYSFVDNFIHLFVDYESRVFFLCNIHCCLFHFFSSVYNCLDLTRN